MLNGQQQNQDNEHEYKPACVHCRKKFDDEQLTEFEGNLYCEDCLEELTSYCDSCGERFFTNFLEEYELANGNTETFCENCQIYYIECYNCGRYEQENDIQYDEENDRFYCQDCYNNFSRNTNYNTHFRDEKIKKSSPLVGLEIEAENGDIVKLKNVLRKTGLNNKLKLTNDGSLNDSGVELITPPANGKYLKDYIKGACDCLDKAGFEGTTRCGLHCHIEIDKNNEKFLRKLFITWLSIEECMSWLVPNSRRTGNYSKLYSNNNAQIEYYDIEKWAKCFDYHLYRYLKNITTLSDECLEMIKNDRYDGARYYSLNFHSVYYRGTAEFRLHSGTTNREKIENWVKLLLAIMNYTKNRYNKIWLHEFKKNCRYGTADKRAGLVVLLLKKLGIKKQADIDYWLNRFNKFINNTNQ